MNNHKRPNNTGTLVQEIFAAHPDWNAKRIYDRYVSMLGDANMAVTLNAVQKHVEGFKRLYEEKQRKVDIPWHLGTLKDYPLQVDAIPYIFAVQDYVERKGFLPISIRVARWISHISVLFKMPLNDEVTTIYQISSYYAEHETISALSGKEVFDTSELDTALRHGELNKLIEDNILCHLTPRERRVIQLRFGLEDGRSRSMEEVGREFSITRERICQIEVEALRKLSHPCWLKYWSDEFQKAITKAVGQKESEAK